MRTKSNRPHGRCVTCAILWVTIGILSASAGPAGAQPSTRDADRERRIEEQLRAIAPNAVWTFRAATEAMDGGNHPEASRLFEEVLREAPTFSPALRRFGGTLIEAGHREAGLAYVELALGTERSPENLATLAEILARPVNGNEASRQLVEQAYHHAQEAVRL